MSYLPVVLVLVMMSKGSLAMIMLDESSMAMMMMSRAAWPWI